jgi:hypothetical protein
MLKVRHSFGDDVFCANVDRRQIRSEQLPQLESAARTVLATKKNVEELKVRRTNSRPF